MNDILQNFYNDISSYEGVDCLNISCFDNSIFFGLSSIYYSQLKNNNLSIIQFHSYIDDDGDINIITNEYQSFKKASELIYINNLYVANQLIDIGYKKLTNNLIVKNDSCTGYTSYFFSTGDFNDIIKYIDYVIPGYLYFNISNSSLSITLSSDSFVFDHSQFEAIGFGKRLTSLNIQKLNRLTYIPISFASKNYNLESLTISNNITKICRGAFESCKSLKKLIFPDSIEIIEKSAFQKCTSLEYIEFGKNIKIIENFAFFSDFNIKTIIIKKIDDILDLNDIHWMLQDDAKIFVDDLLINKYLNYVNDKYKKFYYKLSDFKQTA